MVKDAREQRPPAEQDLDRVDFTWLSNLWGRLRRRMFPDAPVPEEVAAEPSAALAEPVVVPPPDDEGGAYEPVAEVVPGAAPGPWMRRAIAAREEAERQWRYAIPVAMVLILAFICVHNRFGGVDWGDDFALYVRQAKGLAEGGVAQVLEQTRYSVDNSGWSSFSPYSYPWGWPLLMAPVYALFGLDYGMFKNLEVLALCVFLLCFFALVRTRAGWIAATLVTLLIAVSRSFNGATDTVLSDLPFLGFVGFTLWFMDRLRLSGKLLSDRRALVILGLLMTFTWNVRREGIALVVTLAALHFSYLLGAAVRDRAGQGARTVNWRNVALPYGTFAAGTIAFQLILPGIFLPKLPGTSLRNVSPHITYYRDVLAEHLGLKDPGVAMQLFGSSDAAMLALRLFLVLAFVGVVARLLHRFEEDAFLAAYLIASIFIQMVSPYQESRYFFTITPLLVYFGYQALPTLVALLTTRRDKLVRLAAVPAGLGLVGLVMLCGADLLHAIDYHRYYHYTVNGPELPQSKEMIAAVKNVTRGDDVILFFRARAMSLYTDRKAIQGSNLDQLLPRADWYVMEKNSTYSQTPLTDAEGAARGLEKTWENASWVIWRVPPRE